MKWPVLPLGEVATLERVGVQPEEMISGTLYVGLENIETGGELSGIRPIDAGELASSKFAFTDKHLLYGKLRPYLRKVARPNFSGICSTDILPISAGPKLDRNFLHHFLLLDSSVDFATTRSTGANLPRISPSILETLPVPVPTIEEQRRIAAILDQAEALRAKRRQALAKLDTLTQSLFNAMMRSQSEIRYLALEDAVDAIIDYRGKSPTKASYGVPLVTARIVKNGSILTPTEFIPEEDYDSWMRRGIPRNGDVVFTSEAPLGEVAQLGTERVALAQRLLVLRGKDGLLDNGFLMFVLREQSVRDQIERRATGSTVKGIRQNELRKVLLPVPHLSEQVRFSKIIEKLRAAQAQSSINSKKLELLSKSLQHRALRGEL